MKNALIRPLRMGLIAAALAQSLAIGWMVWDRVSLLSKGREILAEVVPVDPRDFFRGDYVILGYRFATAADIALPLGVRKGDAVYATLKQAGPAQWDMVSVATAHPGAVGADEVVLKGRVEWVRREKPESPAQVGRLRYGIENYFVPEGTGRALEKQVLEKRIEAVLAVGDGGDVAIKGLKVDGAMVAQEPLL